MKRCLVKYCAKKFKRILQNRTCARKTLLLTNRNHRRTGCGCFPSGHSLTMGTFRHCNLSPIQTRSGKESEKRHSDQRKRETFCAKLQSNRIKLRFSCEKVPRKVAMHFHLAGRGSQGGYFDRISIRNELSSVFYAYLINFSQKLVILFKSLHFHWLFSNILFFLSNLSYI